MKFLENILEKTKVHFEKGGKLEALYPLFEAGDSFAMTPSTIAKTRPFVRDNLDIKRLMISVVVALVPCIIMAMFNAGYQSLAARGLETHIVDCFFVGAIKVVPIIIVSYSVGGFWEALFALVRKHEINEGFLVTGMLFPLTLPATIPLWQVALGITFGIVIAKEVFGGTGMNILNPALAARAFVFFAYPASISGERVWTAINYNKDTLVEGFTGATPLLVVSNAPAGSNVMEVIQQSYFTWMDCFLGMIPGSLGETSTLACLLGAAFLLITGIASWRVMLGMLIGGFVMASLLNLLSGPESSTFLALPFHYHFVMGGFAFGMIFMATDPVSAAYTPLGKWIYGSLIGILAILIRALNPAYPEGVMLAILFMNIFSPLIDHYVVQVNIKKRMVAIEK
ncbi:MAG: Na+-transporting NADH:ubiquinone oxidoreductase subunit B [Candidatus Omnitrophota bacterium]|jgi:Na+-transporting NADH:ubiquinone oxidoreductase subunit B